jgi:uncharacterized protein
MTLPMLGQMGSFERPSADTGEVLDLYLHGYVSSRIMNLSRKNEGNGSGSSNSNSDASVAAEAATEGLPVTVAASHVDGLVLALTPNSHSYNYRSAVLFGHATIVTDVTEKLYAMELMTNGVVADRWRNTRVPPNNAEIQSTSVLRVRISAGSAKVRSGMPGDDKVDTENAELVERVWTGVVPVCTTLGEPIPGPLNRLEKLPPYLAGYVKDFNETARDGAVEAATKQMKPKTSAGHE